MTGALEFTVHLRSSKEHPTQALLIASTQKRKIVRAGRRGGKTTAAAILAVKSFLKGKRVLYAVPTADQVKKFWYEVVHALREPLQHGVFRKNESEHFIELAGTQQRIRAKTAWNADTLRGDFADVLILDEWQLMDEGAWEEVGAPMLLDNNGDAVFIYTPPSVRSRSTTKARDRRHASKMFKKAEGDPRWLAIHWASKENPHISAEGLKEITADMTSLAYRQEIEAEDIDEVPGALWKLEMIDADRVTEAPALVRVVVGLDPSGGSKNEAGVVACGLGGDGHAYVLHDASLRAPSPRSWAAAACAAYYDFQADRILGERNYGGDMVESVVLSVDESVAYKDVVATRGKLVRAEPCSARYEKHQVHHVGVFPELEEEMCTYVPGEPSPNRMDALVWCLTELLLGVQMPTDVDVHAEVKTPEMRIRYGTDPGEQGDEDEPVPDETSEDLTFTHRRHRYGYDPR